MAYAGPSYAPTTRPASQSRPRAESTWTTRRAGHQQQQARRVSTTRRRLPMDPSARIAKPRSHEDMALVVEQVSLAIYHSLLATTPCVGLTDPIHCNQALDNTIAPSTRAMEPVTSIASAVPDASLSPTANASLAMPATTRTESAPVSQPVRRGKQFDTSGRWSPSEKATLIRLIEQKKVFEFPPCPRRSKSHSFSIVARA